MTLIRESIPGREIDEDLLYDRFMSGECHIHAIAASRLHGGDARFLVVEDLEEMHWEFEDGDGINAVLHVYSIHDVGGVRIARDVRGDRLVSDAQEEAEYLFGRSETQVYETDLEGLLDLTQGRETGDYENPLGEVFETDIADTMQEDSVCVALQPDAPQGEEISADA